MENKGTATDCKPEQPKPHLTLTHCPKCGGPREPRWHEGSLSRPPGMYAVCEVCRFAEPTQALDEVDLGDPPAGYDTPDADVEADFTAFWRDVVGDPQSPNFASHVKRELYDYHKIMDQVSIAYCEVTGGKLSKPNTAARHIIDAAEEHYRAVYCNEEETAPEAAWRELALEALKLFGDKPIHCDGRMIADAVQELRQRALYLDGNAAHPSPRPEHCKLYIKGLHPYAFRVGEPAEIIGVRMMIPNGPDNTPRPCWQVRFTDGMMDDIPLFERWPIDDPHTLSGNFILTDSPEPAPAEASPDA